MVQIKLSEMNREMILRSQGLVHILDDDGSRLASFMRCDPAQGDDRIMGMTKEEADRIIREGSFISSEQLMDEFRRNWE